MGGWLGGWVGSGQVKSLKFNKPWPNWDNWILFEDFLICRDTPTHRWVVGWVSGSMGGVRSDDKKFNKSWPNWDNSILFEDLWFVDTPQQKGGCAGGWLGQWVNGWGQVKWLKNLINLDLIETIQFCLNIYDLLRPPHLWVGVWVVKWMGGSVGQWLGPGHITKYQVKLELIEIIQFYLKIYDL